MSLYCLECWNRITHTKNNANKYIMTDYDDLCEGCGEYKPVILYEKRAYYSYKFRFVIIPLIILGKLLTFPYWVYKAIRLRKKHK